MSAIGPSLLLSVALALLCIAALSRDAAAQRECMFTSECQSMYEGGTDCRNDLGGVCYCGDVPCGAAIVEQTPPLVPEATCYDGIQNQDEWGVDCGGPCPECLALVPPSGGQRECSFTSECQAMYVGATDCANYLGGICYCGDSPCAGIPGLKPVQEPVLEPALVPELVPVVDPPPTQVATEVPERECRFTSECQTKYVGATDCANYMGGICYCGDSPCAGGPVQDPAVTPPQAEVPPPEVTQPNEGPSGDGFTPMLDDFGWGIFKKHGWKFNAAWSDEFNSNPGQRQSPDPQKWNLFHPTGYKGSGSLFDAKMAYTTDGRLVLEKEPSSRPADPNYRHLAGIVSSTATDMNLGYYEVRSKASDGNAANAWWFFDKVGNQGSYEIDVYEHQPWSDWGDQRMHSNIHHFTWSRATGNVDHIKGYGDSNILIPNGRRTKQWNVYGLIREPQGMHIYVNGIKVRSIMKKDVPRASWPGDKPLPVIFSTGVYSWMYSDWCKCLPSPYSTYHEYDYFRVWN